MSVVQLLYTYPFCHNPMDVYLYTGQQWDTHMAMVEAVVAVVAVVAAVAVVVVVAAMVCLLQD